MPGAGAGWVALGGSLAGDEPAGFLSADVSIASDAQGRPLAAFTQMLGSTGNFKTFIFVRRWNGSGWDSVGPGLDPFSGVPSSGQSPSLGVDSAGRPVVAWLEQVQQPSGAAEQQVWGCWWDGSLWRSLGRIDPAPSPAGFVSPPSLVVLPGDRIAVAVSNGPVVRSFDLQSQSWATLGGSLQVDATASPAFQQLAAGPAGELFVAWQEEAPPPAALTSPTITRYVRSWTGSSWVEAGTPLTGGDGVALMADGQARPVVAWVEGQGSGPFQVESRRLEDGSWRDLGAVGGSNAALARGPDGSPVMVRVDAAGNARVARWDGLWNDFGGPLEALGGTTRVFHVAIATSPQGKLLVGWDELDGLQGPFHRLDSEVFVWQSQ